MARKTNSKIIWILTYVMLVIVFVSVVGCFAFLTNGFKNDISTFYVQVNETIYKSDNKQVIILPCDKDIKFDCKLFLEQKQNNSFTVKVLPNIGQVEDFDFYVNDRVYSFCAEKDFTNGFNIKLEKSSFTINIPNNLSILYLLQANYQGQTIKLNQSIDTLKNSYFVIKVSASDGKTHINIPISFYSNIAVTSVELDKGEMLI